jgi:ssDNA-binding replication factor A large subunit
MDFEEILRKIKDKGKLSDEEVQKRIIEKQRELSNLVSKDGAAYIIAKEMGIELFEKKEERRLQIKNIVPKIRVLNINARIVRIFPVKEFESKGRKGKVASLILGDESGTARLTLWDQQTDIVDKVKEGMAVEVFGGYTREDQRGGAEIRLSKSGGLKILENSDLPEVSQMQRPSAKAGSTIAELKEGDTAEIRAAVVQLFETNFFYTVCPECGKRVTKDNDYTCPDHGKVEPKKNIVLSGVVDDGTGNIRAVFFRDNALKLAGMTMDEVLEREDSLFDDLDVLGREFMITGRVRSNKMFKRLEFVANDVRGVDMEAQVNKLINNLKANM